ncbi:MAG: hypothetical protein PWQ88_382 [Candidatus Methanomethylophilaceae archaeon]|nr:hypothetical protein [Candidatus Methanomethylophilaceae archaeon]MDI3541111.1 hypothetical protein [Candidatus Methanomethylophilaceae archaeon]HIJ00554.1 hypothetical protein [Candidatus Methanomethylophilaceae archaeon]
MINKISVDDDVRDYIAISGKDYRVCTSCYGPALVPIEIKPPKNTDLVIKIGNNTLYVSRVQAMYISRVSMDMLYEPEYLNACPAIKEK